jgi:hypothetical protein
MRRFLLMALVISVAAANGMSPQPPFEGRSVKELLLMLDSTNAATRTGAAEAIAWYLERDRFTPNFIEAPLVRQTVSKASLLLQTDKDKIVRLASIDVLFALDTWTNTTSLVALGTTDSDCLIRVRTVSTLHRLCQARNQAVGTKIVNALMGCLNGNTEPGVLCEAVTTAGDLGSEAQPTILLLKQLAQHPNNNVRECVVEALHKLTGQPAEK